MSVILDNAHIVDFEKKRVVKGALLLNNRIIERIFLSNSAAPLKLQRSLHRISCIEKLDLNGNYLIPAFIDSHTHLLAHGIERLRIDLAKCRSLNGCLEKLKANTFGKEVFGVNWDESSWVKGKKEDLSKELLDKISRTKPVIMRRVCGHFAVCNTKALSFIPKNWRIIDRKKGYLYEDAALFLNQIFPATKEMLQEGLEQAVKEANSLGITSIHEITDIRGFKIYQDLRSQLKLRTALYLPLKEMDRIIQTGLTPGFGDDYLKFAGIKVFMDGSIGAKTAAIRRPYTDSQNYGKLLIKKAQLKKIIAQAEENSLQLMIHSIGDCSTETVLRAFEESNIKRNRLRHRLEHLEMLDDKQIKRISKIGLIASMQPNFVRWQNPGGMYEQYLGKRYQKMNCFKRVADAGIKVIFGSDCMPLGPLDGIQYAAQHPDDCGRLGPDEAFKFYTTEPAFATSDEDKKGKIKEGFFADLVVLNKNPLLKENLKELKILMVFLAAESVYKRRSI